MTVPAPAEDAPPLLPIGIAFDGVGWHPGAWQEAGLDSSSVLRPGYWSELAVAAENGGADFVTIDDALRPPAEPSGRVHPRLDAELIAARIAPATRAIGLIPTVTTTHTEPFHVASAIATLDYTSQARAGWQPRVSASASEAAHFGRRTIPPRSAEGGTPAPTDIAPEWVRELFAEAADVVEVARRLWDSWEDGAEIRDVRTRRFIDRDKLHYIDFEGEYFSVRGPSIVPRPPQGQPVVAALGHAPVAYEFAARSADLLFLTPGLNDGPAPVLRQVADAIAAVPDADAISRAGERLRMYADITVLLDLPEESGAARLARLDDAAGAPLVESSDAAVFAGSAGDLIDLLSSWADAGIDGFRLRPGVLPVDLAAITERVLPALHRRRPLPADGAISLRGCLGLPTVVPNRYAPA